MGGPGSGRKAGGGGKHAKFAKTGKTKGHGRLMGKKTVFANIGGNRESITARMARKGFGKTKSDVARRPK